MAHASMPCLNFESPALWPIKTHHDKMDTNSQECAYGPTHYKLYSHGSNVSTKRLVSVLSRTSGTDVSVSSESRDSDVSVSAYTCRLQPCFVGLRAIALWPIHFI